MAEAGTSLTVSPDDTGNFSLSGGGDGRELIQFANFVSKTKQQIAAAPDEGIANVIRAGLQATIADYVDGPILDQFMKLQNQAHGFKTDKDGGYPREVVKEVACAAILRGVRLYDNEMNIIAGGLYVTKDCFKRKIRECEAVTGWHFEISTAIEYNPTGETKYGTKTGYARTSAKATWTQNGKAREYAATVREGGDYRLLCKWFETDTPDLILGKMQSRLFRLVWEMMSDERLELANDIEVDDDGQVIDAAYTVERTVEPIESAVETPEAESEAETADEDPLAEHMDEWKALEQRVESYLIQQLERVRTENEPEDWSRIADVVLERCQARATETRGNLPDEILEAVQSLAADHVELWKKSNRGEQSNQDAESSPAE